MKPPTVDGSAPDWSDLSGALRRFIARRVPADQVDDVVQEALMRIYTGLPKLKDTERMTPWIWRIARNTLADHHRSAVRRDVPMAEVEPAVEAPESDNINAEVATWLRPMMSGLSDAHREALELTELGEMTQAQLAEALGLSLSGAKTRVQRARRKLRDAVEACCALERDGRGNVMAYTPRPDGCTDC